MADTEVMWRGLRIGRGPYHVETISGWDDLPDVEANDSPRSRGHGDHVGDQFARARIVTVTGSIATRSGRDPLARALMAATPVISSGLDTLTVDTFGQLLTADARLVRRSMPVDDDYPSGKVPFALQWRCPSPLRFGLPQAPVVTGLPTAGGGLAYPLTYGLTYGAAATPGQIVLTNEGTAPAPIAFTVTGPLPGFQLSAGDDRIVFVDEVPPQQVITIDTSTGRVVAEGTADRRGSVTVADWMQVPPAAADGTPGEMTVQIASLGAYDPAASLAVLQPRSAHW